MVIRNEDIESVVVEIPEGHTHIRATVRLVDGTEWTLQEAALSNLLRAFVTVKTHPIKNKIALRRVELGQGEMKKGFATHQLLEVDDGRA